MPSIDEFGMPVNGGRNVQADWNQSDSSKSDYIKNKPSLATSSADGFMSSSDKSKLDALNQNEKGYFASPQALRAAYPVGQAGWFATVGSTDSIWSWDTQESDWTDTQSHSINPTWDSIQGKPVLSVAGQVVTIGENSVTVPFQNYKGFFANEAALVAAYPVGQTGWFASVGNMMWIWNTQWKRGGIETQSQADWNQSDNTQVDFIKNKPAITDINYEILN